jgi:glycine/serine hydroxymethyltransferase
MKKFLSEQRKTIRNAKRYPPAFEPEKMPKTTHDWQMAVDAAEALLSIDGARMYGLITGGPRINKLRCLAILEEGRKRGIKPAKDAAVLFTQEWNAKFGQNGQLITL